MKRVDAQRNSALWWAVHRQQVDIVSLLLEKGCPANVSGRGYPDAPLSLAVELIDKDDYSRLGEFDALFIRETTSVLHHTYRFARKAAAEGLVVIDDPESILKCTNKVFLAELLERNRMLIPKTVIVHRENAKHVTGMLGLPCILKKPDSSFSQGVIKVETEEEEAIEEIIDIKVLYF